MAQENKLECLAMKSIKYKGLSLELIKTLEYLEMMKKVNNIYGKSLYYKIES